MRNLTELQRETRTEVASVGSEVLAVVKALRLTDPQFRFCLAWAQDPERNQTAAARAAGCRTQPEIQGSRWARMGKVRAFVALLTATAARKAEERTGTKVMAAAEVLERLSAHARADLGDFLDGGENGNPVSVRLPREKTHLLKEVSVDEGTDKDGGVWAKTRVKIVDQQGALNSLARIYRMDESGDESRTVRISEARVLIVNLLTSDPEARRQLDALARTAAGHLAGKAER